MGSSWTRARTHVPCIDRRILNRSTTREVPNLHSWMIWTLDNHTLPSLGLLNVCAHSYSEAREYLELPSGLPRFNINFSQALSPPADEGKLLLSVWWLLFSSTGLWTQGVQMALEESVFCSSVEWTQVMSAYKSLPPLGTNISNLALPRIKGAESTRSPCGSLGERVIGRKGKTSTLSFPNPYIPSAGETVSYSDL